MYFVLTRIVVSLHKLNSTVISLLVTLTVYNILYLPVTDEEGKTGRKRNYELPYLLFFLFHRSSAFWLRSSVFFLFILSSFLT